MLDLVTDSITSYLVSNNAAKEEDRDVYKYGLAVLLYNIFLVVFIVLLSFFLHNVIETIVFLITLIVMRKYTGGHHANTRLKCFVTSLTVYSLAAIADYLQSMWFVNVTIVISLAISCVLMLLFAPICGEQIQWSSSRKNYMKKCNRICLVVFLAIILVMNCLKFKTYAIYISLAIIATSFSLVIEILRLREGKK